MPTGQDINGDGRGNTWQHTVRVETLALVDTFAHTLAEVEAYTVDKTLVRPTH